MTLRSLLPLIAAAAIMPTASLHAATVIYSFTGKDASGSLKGVPFTAKSFSITSTASTSDVHKLPDSGLYRDIHSVRVKPTIELITEIGNFKLTLPVSESFTPAIQSANYDAKTPVYSLHLFNANPALVEKISELLSLDPNLFAKDQALLSNVATFFSKDPNLNNPEFALKHPNLFLKLSTLADKEPALFEQIVKTFGEYPNAFNPTLELASNSAELNDLRSKGEFNGHWTDQFSFSTETSMGDLSLSLAGSSFEANFAVEIFDEPADPSPVPEPATAASSLLLSLAGLSLISRRNRKA
jgi:hypothetical protein